MALKRTVVYVEASDLAAIKEAAARGNLSEAEIIRNAIHLAALRVQRRSRPLRLRRFTSGDPALAERVDDYLADDFGRDAETPLRSLNSTISPAGPSDDESAST